MLMDLIYTEIKFKNSSPDNMQQSWLTGEHKKLSTTWMEINIIDSHNINWQWQQRHNAYRMLLL